MMRATYARIKSARQAYAVLGALATAACNGGARANETTHPEPESLPVNGEVTVTLDSIPVGLTRPAGDRWAEARRSLLEARTVLTLGSDAIGPDMFAAIADVEIAPNGEVFVLDDQFQEVRIFDAGGRMTDKIGGIGDGPLEFRYANGIALLSDGRLFVSSRGPRGKLFARPDSSRWVLDEVIELPIGIRGVCSTASGRLFVTGYKRDNNTLVHELAPGGGIVRSFATGYQSDHWLLQAKMGQGSVECADGPDRVIFGHSVFPLVRAFGADTGEVLWAANIEGFQPLPIYEGVDEQGRRYVRNGREQQWDMLGSIHALSSGHLLLQTGHAVLAERRTTVHSYLVDAETGHGAFLGSTLPRLIPVLGGYVALFEDPYPRLEIRMFPGGSDQSEPPGERRPNAEKRAEVASAPSGAHHPTIPEQGSDR